MDSCTGHCDITEIFLKIELNVKHHTSNWSCKIPVIAVVSVLQTVPTKQTV